MLTTAYVSYSEDPCAEDGDQLLTGPCPTQIFESPAKTIIGLERLMLESSGFDFRNRHPQKVLLKLARLYNVGRESIGKTAYYISLDLYRTFAPLKQSSSTMAFASFELAIRVHDEDPLTFFGTDGPEYEVWGTSRAEVMGTLLPEGGCGTAGTITNSSVPQRNAARPT